ncbi:hypothetical protein X739_26675 [Mesorhizobium sp. LNHC220B00]|nr:hypothetical protein X739_26675 [Mesorhizobium sp. LNHC220B00]ESY86490.1 hypothetical protein X741_33085 [Mesorhizobium sp. LNHC229A00]ESY98411.1 hypothetical protein X738_17125 [Mesorhizobium sp. LNHC209A00]
MEGSAWKLASLKLSRFQPHIASRMFSGNGSWLASTLFETGSIVVM